MTIRDNTRELRSFGRAQGAQGDAAAGCIAARCAAAHRDRSCRAFRARRGLLRCLSPSALRAPCRDPAAKAQTKSGSRSASAVASIWSGRPAACIRTSRSSAASPSRMAWSRCSRRHRGARSSRECPRPRWATPATLLRWLPDARSRAPSSCSPIPGPSAASKAPARSRQTLTLLARVLKPGAELRFGTDIGDYARSALEAFHAEKRFCWQAERPADWRIRPADWPETRYEAKAEREGRVRYYFRFRRL